MQDTRVQEGTTVRIIEGHGPMGAMRTREDWRFAEGVSILPGSEGVYQGRHDTLEGDWHWATFVIDDETVWCPLHWEMFEAVA